MKLSFLIIPTLALGAKIVGYNGDFVRTKTRMNDYNMRQLKTFLVARPRRRQKNKSRTVQLTNCFYDRAEVLCLDKAVDNKGIYTTFKPEQ